MEVSGPEVHLVTVPIPGVRTEETEARWGPVAAEGARGRGLYAEVPSIRLDRPVPQGSVPEELLPLIEGRARNQGGLDLTGAAGWDGPRGNLGIRVESQDQVTPDHADSAFQNASTACRAPSRGA